MKLKILFYFALSLLFLSLIGLPYDLLGLGRQIVEWINIVPPLLRILILPALLGVYRFIHFLFNNDFDGFMAGVLIALFVYTFFVFVYTSGREDNIKKCYGWREEYITTDRLPESWQNSICDELDIKLK